MNLSSQAIPIEVSHRHAAIRGSACRRSGFTIMELFVVITIMTVLSAILLPALNKGRSRSQSISCLNNLRQLQLAWQMFPDDHDGMLPPNNYVNGFKMGKLVGDFGPSWCPGDTRTDATTQNIQQGELYSYVRSASVYHCPSDVSKIVGFADSQITRTRSYSMSGSMGCSVSDADYLPSYLQYSEMANYNPSRLFVFIDAHEDAIVDAHFAMKRLDSPDGPDGRQGKDVWVDLPADRHDQAGNLSFADGHVERWKWKAPKYFFEQRQQQVKDEEQYDALRLRGAMRQP